MKRLKMVSKELFCDACGRKENCRKFIDMFQHDRDEKDDTWQRQIHNNNNCCADSRNSPYADTKSLLQGCPDLEKDSGKHVTIAEELPLVYNPRSFSVPNLLCTAVYEKSIHKHPTLQLSISNPYSDQIVRKYIHKHGHSPHLKRKQNVKTTLSAPSNKTIPKLHKRRRARGHSYPPTCKTLEEIYNRQKASYNFHETGKDEETTNRTALYKKREHKWLHFLSKLNIFKKQKHEMTARPRFDDLPVLRTSVSSSFLLDAKANEELAQSRKSPHLRRSNSCNSNSTEFK